jgi:hypothetical protein
MGNTSGTTNATVIAQKALETLIAKIPFLKKITTDFSDQKAKFNEQVVTHIVTAAAATNFEAETGYAPADRTQADVPVTINKHKHHTYKVGVNEASSSRINLIERYAVTAAYSLASAMIADLCELVTSSNYTNASQIDLGAGVDGFTRKGLILLGTALSKRNVAPMGRFALLNPDYYGSLSMDNVMLTALLQAGADAVTSGVLPNLHGFDVMEFASLPTNSQKLAGFVGTPDCMVIATRLPDDPGQGSSTCAITIATEPESGLSVQVREWYNADLAQFRRTYTLMYGVAKGQATSLQRITTA